MSISVLKKEELQKLLKSEGMEECHSIIRAIAGKTRYRIIKLLEEYPPGLTVSHLAEILESSPSKISHQLRILKNNDLVFGNQKGQKITYQLNTKRIKPFLL